jgi:hypothetical protein
MAIAGHHYDDALAPALQADPMVIPVAVGPEGPRGLGFRTIESEPRVVPAARPLILQCSQVVIETIVDPEVFVPVESVTVTMTGYVRTPGPYGWVTVIVPLAPPSDCV